MKCLHFLVKHNIPHTTVFKDFVEFGTDELQSPVLAHHRVGGNANYTSHRIADKFLDAMVDDIEEIITARINSFCILCDDG